MLIIAIVFAVVIAALVALPVIERNLNAATMHEIQIAITRMTANDKKFEKVACEYEQGLSWAELEAELAEPDVVQNALAFCAAMDRATALQA